MSYQDVKDTLYRGHRKIANNTYLTLRQQHIATVEEGWTKEEFVEMRLHGNLVAKFYPDFLQLYSAGWYTNTTKSRLNLALAIAINNRLHTYIMVYQTDYQWYYGRRNSNIDTMTVTTDVVKFYDGMRINYSGEVIN